jgi:hypothetical protein
MLVVGVCPAFAEDPAVPPRSGSQVGRYRVATYNIGAWDYDKYDKTLKTTEAACLNDDAKPDADCAKLSGFPDRRAGLKKIIGRVRANASSSVSSGVASVVVLQELSTLGVYTSKPKPGQVKPQVMPYGDAVAAMMVDLGYRRPDNYPSKDNPRSARQEGTGTVSADGKKDTRIHWTMGTQIFFQEGFYEDITVGSSKFTDVGLVTATEAMARAVQGTGIPPLLVKDYSGSNRTEKVFPYVRLKVAGDSAFRAREQILVGGVHLPLPKPTVLAAKYKTSGPWIQEKLIEGFDKLLVPLAKKKPKTGKSGTTTRSAIPLVIMGDFNATYAPVGRDGTPYKYKTTAGVARQVDVVPPAEKLVNLKMVDTRSKRWGVDPLTTKQKKDGTTLNKRGKSYKTLDYVFYRWKNSTKAANFRTRKDALYVSDHRKISVTLWFQ